MKLQPKQARKIFWKQGACSSSLFHILNLEFDHPYEEGVCAAGSLAGGIMQLGFQCGMLWGSALAIGAESYRRYGENPNRAITVTITATQRVMESFKNRTNSHDCLDITDCDWTNKLSVAKYMLTGKFLSCFRLIEKWAPEAIQVVEESLAVQPVIDLDKTISCATEVARKMGASEEQSLTVAGFAGGLGLSGNACGALAAALWIKSLDRKRSSEKLCLGDMFNPEAKKTLEAFQKKTEHTYLCSELTGKRFRTIDEHTEFIRNGGCAELIQLLASS